MNVTVNTTTKIEIIYKMWVHRPICLCSLALHFFLEVIVKESRIKII